MRPDDAAGPAAGELSEGKFGLDGISPSQRWASDADGSGNVTSLTWAINGHHYVVATDRYDPFGRSLSHTGTSANKLRFSSKFLHDSSGLYDYGFRFYEPETQRWLTRDPLGEAGGLNLYGFVGNDPVNGVDPYGLFADAPDGFPRTPTGTALDSYLYDEETKDEHDRIMCNAYQALADTGNAALFVAEFILPEGKVLKALLRTKFVRFFYDTLHFKSINWAYWHGTANGWSLHHWLFPQRSNVPPGIRNAGWNLLVIPGWFNSYMNGRGWSRVSEWGIRLGIPASPGETATWPIWWPWSGTASYDE